MINEHLNAKRGWALVQKRLQLTRAEREHLQDCDLCYAWLLGFTEMAHKVGFDVVHLALLGAKKKAAS
jgi:hypothetical protein